ncbi:MAG: PilC/PilY family type IV pilus protein [Gammaproteobacteria bacterium]|nr:PilC/PilY family type IV pilus protein [Gammaproteobacteria bacterium]
MNTLTNMKKTLISGSAFALLLHAASSYAALDVSQQPLMLVDSVAPNLIFSLDDSGSMKRSHVPDGIAADATMRTRRVKSSDFNPIYFNPDVEYIIPTGVDSSGADINYSSTFSNAPHMGFKPQFGTVDLRDSYRATWYCTRDLVGDCSYTDDGFGSIKELAENPASDFQVSQFIGSATSLNINTASGITYRVSRTGRSGSSCSAQLIWNGINFGNTNHCAVTGSNDSNRGISIDLRQRAVPAYYYTFDPTVPGCPTNGSTANDNCYRINFVTNAEQQNFAIWYSFYRDRALATQSAALLAFYDLPSSTRLTWQSLNNCTNLNSGARGCGNNRFRAFTNRHKANFLQWLIDAQFSGGTPLRLQLDRAGKFLQSDVAWANNPNPFTASGGNGQTVTNPVHACRPSFNIVMTDGMWNGANGSPTGILRADHTNFTTPDGTEYSNTRRPFANATTNTLADLAMHYWATDLNTSLDNEIKPFIRFPNSNSAAQFWDPRNNPATWQSMTNYMVGVGLNEALNNASVPWEGDTFTGGYLNILNGTANWPAASGGHANNVYDLWHAAVNSRGEFFSADRPEEIVSAFEQIINRIAERTSTAGRPGVSASVSLDGDLADATITNRIFETVYDSTDGWTGDIVRRDIVRQGDGTVTSNEIWSAANKITNQGSSRNIYMRGSGSSGLTSFSWSALSAEEQAIFAIDPLAPSATPNPTRGQQRVEYIRGVRTGEGVNDNQFRQRRVLLGDIINSSPVIVGPANNIPYLMDRIDGNPGDYLDFVRASMNRPELAYVGANDGMLHAIFAGSRETTETQQGFEGGKQAFGFIPSAVIPNLPRLTAQSYTGGNHRFFVDGTPVVRDVYFDNAWRTVLIGTLRAGGKSVFALDITNPGLDGSGVKLLWEISNQDADFADLGYSFARPEIARLHSGQWGVLLGNGYDSVDGKAVMYVIDIATGSRLAALEVDDGSDSPNGLSSVRGADNNSDGIVDYAYAGDLQGNLWRFDLVTTGNVTAPDPFASSVVGTLSPSSFAVSYGGSPMFTATASNGQPQAITGLPSLVRHPTRRGYLVIVGTGKYFETSDASPDTSKANTVYAIWDRYTRRQSTSSSLALASRSNLQIQSITQETTTSFGGVPSTVRVVSDNNIQWYQAGTTPADEDSESRVNRRGWALDLTVSNTLDGEMMVNDMLARGGTLLFSTITPNDDPCADGLSSRLYGINAATGARLSRPPFDFSRDGRISGDDFLSIGGNLVPPSGIDLAIPGGIPLTPDGLICGNDGQCIEFIVPPEDQGRTSWQDMPTPEPDDDDDETDPADEG